MRSETEQREEKRRSKKIYKARYYYAQGRIIKTEGIVENDTLHSFARLFVLFLHQELHYHFGGVGHRGAGAEDGGNTGFVEEVVVLRGDDTTGSDLVGSGDP